MIDSKQRFDTMVFAKEFVKLRKTLLMQENDMKNRLPGTINPS
jgi:hypothetical protein